MHPPDRLVLLPERGSDQVVGQRIVLARWGEQRQRGAVRKDDDVGGCEQRKRRIADDLARGLDGRGEGWGTDAPPRARDERRRATRSRDGEQPGPREGPEQRQDRR